MTNKGARPLTSSANIRPLVPGCTKVLLLLLLWGVLLSGSGLAQAGYVGTYGGGSLIDYNTTKVQEIKNSGFTEVIVWNLGVAETTGDLHFNSLQMVSNGTYIGNESRPNFVSDLEEMKQGTVKRVTFSIGYAGGEDYQYIEALVNSNGTGKDSILYKNFQALKEGIPPLDAIDFDDEDNYDTSSTTAFAVMLGELGYHVTISPYTMNDYWTGLVSDINTQLPGTVDGVHLQCYSGGAGNSPCSGWDFGSVPVYPGLWDQSSTPSEVQSQMSSWHSECNITGGFLWLYDDIAGNGEAAQYAEAILSGVD